MKKRLSILSTLSLLLAAACSEMTPSPVEPTSTFAPTPTAFTDYILGAMEVPAGHFLFIELTSSSSCSSECHCPVVEPPPSRYEFSGEGGLWMDQDAFGGAQTLAEMMDNGLPGFYGYGRWREGIYAITSLPYVAPPYEIMQIYSIRPDGSAVINILELTMLLAAGSSWSDSSLSIQDSPPGCTMRYDTRLANNGFLSRDQIHACPNLYDCR